MAGIKKLIVVSFVLFLVTAGLPYVPPLSNQSPEIWGKFYVSQASSIIISQEIAVDIATNRISISGCNVQRASFTFEPISKDYTVGPFASTLKYCENDQGVQISSIISNSKKVYNRNGVIVFESALGYEVLKLTSNSPFSTVNPNPVPTSPARPNPPTPSWPFEPIPTTPIVLPGVIPTSFKGAYFFKPVSTDFPTAIFNFDDDNLEFEGCNFQRLPYAAYTDGVFCLLQGGSSTLRYCKVDYDGAYIQLLTQASRFQKTEAGYDLYDQDRLVARLEKKIRNQVVKYSVIYGGYQLEIKGVDVLVSQNTISFNAGCNSVSISYQVYNGAISFGPATSTLKFCDKDVDSIYVNAITRAVSLKKITEGFALLDAYGVQTIRFVGFTRERGFSCSCFGGSYKLQLPNAGIRLKISDGTFTLEGCNTHNFKFTLSDNGNIVFGVPSSTEVACEVNNDNAFLYALLKAQSIAVVNTNILFFDGNNDQVVKATNFEQSNLDKNNNNDVVIDPRSPVVPTFDYFFFEGIYKFSVVGSSLKTLSLTIEKSKINWRGCNIWNMNYVAASDGTIKFYPGVSTRMACPSDNDKFYVDALLSAVRFSEMKGMITFYNEKGKSVVSFVYDAVASGTAPSTVLPAALPPVVPNSPPAPTPQPRPEFKPFSESFVSLKGQYKFHLPKINFDILGDSFVFRGCNTHRIPCTWRNANVFFGQSISTNNKCDGNFDNYFLNLIPKVSTFQRNNNQVTFFNSLSQPVFKASTIVNKNQEFASGISSGSYETQPNPIDVNFGDNNLFFNDCNRNNFGYNAKNTGDFSVQAQGTSQACSSIQNFESYSSAVSSATKYRNIDNGFILEDNKGNEKARCLKI